MTRRPWSSIASGVVPQSTTPLGYAEASGTSPCATCATAPCCTFMPLDNFRVSTLSELDRAIYLLNFQGIELGIHANGEWSAYYKAPCRHLDRERVSCRVHDSPEQPRICWDFSPYTCWYKKVLTQSVHGEYLRIDRSRMAVLLRHVVFDDARNIIRGPDWTELVREMAAQPAQPADPDWPPPEESAATTEWRELVRRGDSGRLSLRTVTWAEGAEPCDGCGAQCCHHLLFKRPRPTSRASLDYLKLCLGFPGVEVAIAEDTWWLIVRATCRHLDGDRCGVYGRPERPLACRYLDPWRCTLKGWLSGPRPAGFFRVGLEHFPWLVECFRFYQTGEVVSIPPVETLRHHVEARWRSALAAGIAGA